MTAEPLLSVTGIETYYGPIQAIRGVTLAVHAGPIVTVPGANGAGKTTVLRTIAGVLNPARGQVRFQGRDIAGLSPDRVMRLGICHVPEGRELFPLLTVRENLMTGAFTRRDNEIARDLEMCHGYFPVLAERASQRAGLLSGGEQQMLAISRALMGRPRLLLLDETSFGLLPLLISQIFEIIRQINHEQGVAILLVEQNANIALNTAEYRHILEVGRIVMRGTCAELLEKEDIKEFYLGQQPTGARGVHRWRRKKLWRRARCPTCCAAAWRPRQRAPSCAARIVASGNR